MIPRYSREPMARIWSEENKFAAWLKVELAAMAALADAGGMKHLILQLLRKTD